MSDIILRLLEDKAMRGNVASQIALGTHYFEDGDYPRAYAWSRIASGKGDSKALDLFWKCYSDMSNEEKYLGEEAYHLLLHGCLHAKFCDPVQEEE